MSNVAEKLSTEIEPADSDQDIELLLLAAAGAVQRLFAERTALRNRTAAQERELTRLRAQVGLIHDGYRRLTTEFVTQFQLMEEAVDDFVREPGQQAQMRASERDAQSDL